MSEVSICVMKDSSVLVELVGLFLYFCFGLCNWVSVSRINAKRGIV